LVIWVGDGTGWSIAKYARESAAKSGDVLHEVLCIAAKEAAARVLCAEGRAILINAVFLDGRLSARVLELFYAKRYAPEITLAGAVEGCLPRHQQTGLIDADATDTFTLPRASRKGPDRRSPAAADESAT